MSAPLDYLAVAGLVGSRNLTAIVDGPTLAVLAPDYILIPEPLELPTRLLEWVEHIGTIVHGSVPVHIYFVGDEFTEYALGLIRRAVEQ